MGSTLNLSLTDELRSFVDEQSGDRTLYATPNSLASERRWRTFDLPLKSQQNGLSMLSQVLWFFNAGH